MRWINYQHLFYFWNVATCGGVTQAARKLRLAQPTISAQLKSFEDVLGEKLFDRSGRTLRLSEAGKLAFKYANEIFALGQEFLEVLDGNTNADLPEIKIGISDVLPKIVSYRLIEPALRPESKSQVTCLEDKTERLLADLAIGEIDIVITDRPIPSGVKVKSFNHFIGESDLVLMASKALTTKFKKNFPHSLVGAPLILPTNESAIRLEIDAWLERMAISPQIVASFQDRALMKIAAREGRGIIPVPAVVENDVASEFGLQKIGKVSEIKERVYMISLERRIKNPVIAKLIDNAQRRVFS